MGLRRLAFVASRRANLFMAELLDGLAAGVRDAASIEAGVVWDAFPPVEDGLAYVVVPHELFQTLPLERWPTDAQLRRTVALCTEQPGTLWFDLGAEHARRCGAVGDISPVGVAALRAAGLPAERIAIGHLPAWDRWSRDLRAARPVDVLFLGSYNRRRGSVLARSAPWLWPHRANLVVTHEHPKLAPGSDFVVGAGKHELMARSSVLLSPGRSATPYFEWVRGTEAIINGSVFVCEHAAGCEPLIPGEHFVAAAAEDLGRAADELLRDPGRLEAMRLAAYDVLRDEQPMAAGGHRLAELAEAALTGAAGPAGAATPPGPLPAPAPSAPTGPPEPAHVALAGLREQAGALAREVAALEARLVGADDPCEPELLHTTPSWADAEPRVSVLVRAGDDEHIIGRTISSVAAQSYEALEVVVLDDASVDGTAEAARSALAARPGLAGRLVRTHARLAPGQAHARLAGGARGEILLLLDADDTLYPPAVERLVTALDAAPDAPAAYPTVHEADDLRSYRAWDPALLALEPIVQGPALVRRTALAGPGDDLRIERLAAAAAERGERLVHVPEILARVGRRLP